MSGSMLIVDLFPSLQEEREGKAMVGWVGKKLRYLTSEVAGQAQFMHTFVHGRLAGGATPSPAQLHTSLPKLWDNIAETDPDIIVTLKKETARCFFPKATFASIRGKAQTWVHPQTSKAYTVYPMYHPEITRPGKRAELYKTLETEWGGIKLKEKPGKYMRVTGAEARALFQAHNLEPFAFDLETEKNHWPELLEGEEPNKKYHTFQAIRSKIIGWSFAFRSGEAYYCTDDVACIRGPLEDPEWKVICHNLLFEYSVLQNVRPEVCTCRENSLVSTKLNACLLPAGSIGIIEMKSDNVKKIPEPINDMGRNTGPNNTVSPSKTCSPSARDYVPYVRPPHQNMLTTTTPQEKLEEGSAFPVTKNSKESMTWSGCAEHSATCPARPIKIQYADDTKVMAFLVGKVSSHLKDLTATMLGIRQTKFDEVNWDNIEEVVQYGAADSDYTYRIWVILLGALRESSGLLFVYTDIDLAVTEALSESQRDGFLVDQAGLDRVRSLVHSEREAVVAELHTWEPREGLKFSSPQQLGEWLYGSADSGYWKIKQELKTRTHIEFIPPGLGLVCPTTTDGGQPSTSINTLHSLEHPVADLLIKLKSADKFLSGHVKTFGYLAQEDGRVHPSYHLSGHWEVDDEDKSLAPGTGRLSSSGPNGQQITNYGDDSRPYVFTWGQALRRCIIPEPGCVFLEGDFAQQEPRIGAMVSEDSVMDHLLQTADVYKPAAMDLYHVELEAVTKDMRQIGKRAWMAWLNRAGPAGIQRSAWWLSKEEASEWIYTQDERYSTFTEWCAEQFDFLVRHEYVETYYGRRIYLPQVASPHPADREAAYRACIPGIIQGTGADVFKLCLKEASPYLRSLGGKLPFLVHDAIVGELKLERESEAITFLAGMSKGMMPSPLPIEVMRGFTMSKLDMVDVTP